MLLVSKGGPAWEWASALTEWTMQEARDKPRCPLQSQLVGQCPQAVPVPPHFSSWQDPALDGVSASTGQQMQVQLRQAAEVAWHLLSPKSKAREKKKSHRYHKTQNLLKFSVLLQSQRVDQPINLVGEASQEPRKTHASRLWIFKMPSEPFPHSVPTINSRFLNLWEKTQSFFKIKLTEPIFNT